MLGTYIGLINQEMAMIKYTLACNEGHEFESWFENAAAYEKLSKAGMMSCVECGSMEVQKSLMAPRVRTDRAKAARPETLGPAPVETQPIAGAQDPKLAEAIEAIKTHVEKNSRYVGRSFSKVARDMHFGDQKQEAIHGEASAEEAKSLLDDGISVVPLPFLPKQKLN